jgi:hypothetical protein
MTRTTSATTNAATNAFATRPIHLVRMGWATEVRSCAYDINLTWNSEVWSASGLEIQGLDRNGGTLVFPNGNSDPWLALVTGEIPRGRTITIYEHQTDFTVSPNQSDATVLFAGEMDECTIGDRIKIKLVESSTNKTFPPTSINTDTYTHLPDIGTRIQWGIDTVTVNG